MVDSRELSVAVVVEAWVLGLTSLALSVAFLTFNIRMRRTRIIKMSSPHLNILTALGGILISITCVLFGLDYFLYNNHSAVSRVCQIRTGVLVVSTSLIFGPMFAKAWRVNRIFKQAAVRRVVIRDKKLFLMTGCLLLVDLVLVAVWQGIEPVQYKANFYFNKVITEKGLKISDEDVIRVLSCCSDNSDVWMAGIFTFKTIILLYGLHLAWQTRNVMLPSMNDARSIIVTALTTVTLATFATSVTMLLRAWPNAVYGCVILSIWLCNMAAMCSVFVPKVMLWWKNPDSSNFRVNLKTDQKLTNGLQSFDQLEEELYHVVTENLALKKSIQEKDTTIKELQQHLTSARDKLLHLTEDQVKQDSGLDIDISSSSGHEDDYTGSRPDEDISSIHGDSYYPMHHHPSPDILYRTRPGGSEHSSISMASLNKLHRLKESIFQDISQANTISANLRSSISKDLDQLGKRRSWIYDSVRSRQELAGSIAKSYNLDDNGDTFSYVSSYLPPGSVYNLDPGSKRRMHYGSAESLATLANDRLYPSVTEQRREARRKIRQESWNRDARRNVYTINNVQQAQCYTSGQSKHGNNDTFV